MNTCEFTDTKFDTKTTRANFIFSQENDKEPKYVYRLDAENFEIRNSDNSNYFQLNCTNVDEKVNFQHANHFYLNERLYVFIAAKSIDGLNSVIYLVDTSKKPAVQQLVFNRQIKGIVTNIFVSNALKNDQKEDYYIVTIGTLDSAVYVFRTTAEMTLEKQALTCALLRTDARNAITQQLIVLDTQSKSPADVYILCGGSNGIIDIFLMKGDSKIENEPEVEFRRHHLLKLPSNLPIVSMQCHKFTDQEVLLAISQELYNPTRISRSIEPSVSVVKFNTHKLMGKDVRSMTFKSGTHIIRKETMIKEPFYVWTCYADKDGGQFMLTQYEFDTKKFEFGDRTNTFLPQAKGKALDIQQVAVFDKDSCLVLGKEALQKLKSANPQLRKRKRQLST
ncbi:uncharacterized protein ATC70_000942 [Mucor velutinosus]|uniref:Uncharacterized protein n=1 Tax=Mucor velutinosus TaxID=708070 RepID=A0AAN7DIF7_9FUNG|nr:hypothetical protein ATC70_000942 [Mucor velutinosus]